MASQFATRDSKFTAAVPLLVHAELAKTEWFEDGLANVLLLALVGADKGLSGQDLASRLPPEIRHTRSIDQISGMAESLCESGFAIDNSGIYQTTAQGRAHVSDAKRELEVMDQRLKERYVAVLRSHGLTLPFGDVWGYFTRDALIPSIENLAQQSGAIALERPIALLGNKRLSELAERMEKNKDVLQKAVAEFLDPTDADIRKFTYAHYATALFRIALSADEPATAEAILAFNKTETIHLILDTNILFSLLGMHDKASNDAARRLIDLVSTLDGTMDIKVSMLSGTVAEAKSALTRESEFWGERDMAPNVASATLATGHVSGLSRSFLEGSERSTTPVSAARYFANRKDSLVRLISAIGVDVADGPDELEWAASKDLEQRRRRGIFAYPQQERAGRRNKTSKQLNHDFVLREYVRRKRPRSVSMVTNAQVWAVTADSRLLDADRALAKNYEELQCVMHIRNVIALLQVLAPRSDEMEAALVSAVTHPLLFGGFDSRMEKSVLEISRQLSDYEDIPSLSGASLGKVLADESLHAIASQSETDEDRAIHLVETIESKLVSELVMQEELNNALSRENQAVEERYSRVERTLIDLRSRRDGTPRRRRPQTGKRAGSSPMERTSADRARQLKREAKAERRRADRNQQKASDLEKRLAFFRTLIVCVLPVAAAAVLAICVGAIFLRLRLGWTFPQITLFVSPSILAATSLCTHLGPWKSGRSLFVRVFGRYIPIAIFGILWSVAATWVIAAFNVLD